MTTAVSTAVAFDNITKAKVVLISDHPFFGALLMRYPIVEDSKRCPTMATDGRRVWYNDTFTSSLTRQECTGVLAHEACHIAFLHHLRIGTRNPMLWNVACDFAINLILKESGFTLPANGLIDQKYAGMSAEHIYDLLIDDIKNGKIKIVYVDGTSDGTGRSVIKAQDWGDVEMPEGMSESERSAEEAETRVRVLQAAETAKSRGKLPAAFQGLINEFLEPKVNWRDRLRTFIGGNRPDDYSYRRPNRKHMILSNLYLPTVEYTGAGTVVIGVDSSGSVSNLELAQFLGEIKAIHSEMRPDALYILWVDTQIHHVGFYGPNDEFDDNKRYACGGTVLRPAFDWVEENGVKPDSFIFLTDMEIGSDMDNLRPNYPVLWVSTGGDRAPFGEVIKIKAG